MSSAAISTLSAHLLAVIFSASYVGSVYVVGKIQPGNRDDSPVIRSRLTAVAITSALSCAGVYSLVARFNPASDEHTLARTLAVLGISWPGSILSCLQTPLLFLGPLYARQLDYALSPRERRSSMTLDFGVLATWIGFRNYIWGPLTEEVVFRACVLAVYAMAGAARWKMVVFAPLVFGLAHVHHAWEVYNRLGRTKAAFQRAAFSAIFQTAFTTLFGAHASYLFLRTSSLVPPLTAHTFCNTMGIPQIGAEIRQFPAYKRSIIGAYVLGIALFAYTMVPWTAPGNQSLYWSRPGEFMKLLLAY